MKVLVQKIMRIVLSPENAANTRNVPASLGGKSIRLPEAPCPHGRLVFLTRPGDQQESFPVPITSAMRQPSLRSDLAGDAAYANWGGEYI